MQFLLRSSLTIACVNSIYFLYASLHTCCINDLPNSPLYRPTLFSVCVCVHVFLRVCVCVCSRTLPHICTHTHTNKQTRFHKHTHAQTGHAQVADLVKLVRIIITATTTSKFMAVRLAACVVFLIPRLPARPQPQAQHRHLSQHPPPPCATLALQQQQQQPTGAITSTHGARADHNQPVGVSKLIHSAQAGSAHGLPGGVVTHTHGARADPDQVDCECPQGTHLGGHAAGSTQQGSTPFPENLPHNAPITFVMMLGSAILAASPGMLLAGVVLLFPSSLILCVCLVVFVRLCAVFVCVCAPVCSVCVCAPVCMRLCECATSERGTP